MTSATNAMQSPVKNGERRGAITNYEYQTLEEISQIPHNASSVKRTHNVFGVVIDHRPVEKSKGSDFYSILRIVDPTLCTGEGVKVTLFHRDDNFFPKINQWDIVRLHRVKSSLFNGQLSLISTHGWSWIIWSGKPDQNNQDDFQTPSLTCTIVESDKTKIRELRRWITKEGFMELDQAQNEYGNDNDQKLENVVPGSFFNIICQVTGMVKVRDNFVCLKVWDATLPHHRIESPDFEGCVMETLSCMQAIDDYMVDVGIFDNHVNTVEEEEIFLGSFVRIRNLHAYVKSRNVDSAAVNMELNLHGGITFNRGIVSLDEGSDCVENLKEEMTNIISKLKPDDTSLDSDINRIALNGDFSLLASDSPTPMEEAEVVSESRDYRSEALSDIPSTSKLHRESISPNKRRKMNSDTGSICSSRSSDVFETPPERSSFNNLRANSKQMVGPPSAVKTSATFEIQINAADSPEPEDTLNMLTSMDKGFTLNHQTHDSPSTTVSGGVLEKPQQHESTHVNEESLKSTSTSFPHDSNEVQVQHHLNNEEESQDESQNGALRCQQESATVVFGEDSPIKISSLKDVGLTEVPICQSKMFRIRAKIFRSPKKHYVYHYCPTTNLNIPASNDGENLKIPDEIHKSLKLWRKYSGIEAESNDSKSEDEDNAVDEELGTQWVFPGEKEERSMIRTVTHSCVKDNSHWEQFIKNSDIMRKRRRGNSKFTILYLKNPQHDSDLKTLSKTCNTNRVIKFRTKDALTSNSIPPVAYQDGIYYYCSPACVGDPSVPSIAKEADQFDAKKPLWALECPALRILYNIKLLLEDDTDAIEVSIKGNSAVEFFNGITPAQFLLNSDGCADLIREELKVITSSSKDQKDSSWVEMIIEKRSRKPVQGEAPVVLYDVINTRLRLW
ncbi:uncharacterized protein LOC143460535 [Clavelina lepadiformis]|uniref:uncharacterized protein LOC143460535 n=1 Tax=Clavelina lepadiformis TaxID=159417 RepID=UPI0040438423